MIAQWLGIELIPERVRVRIPVPPSLNSFQESDDILRRHGLSRCLRGGVELSDRHPIPVSSLRLGTLSPTKQSRGSTPQGLSFANLWRCIALRDYRKVQLFFKLVPSKKRCGITSNTGCSLLCSEDAGAVRGLRGCVALVTGAGRGMGRAPAEGWRR